MNSIIDEIRYFQRYEMHEEALDVAQKADIELLNSEEKVTVCKLIALSYRKLECADYALVYINKAINILEKDIQTSKNKSLNKELAICMMNKGVIYDSQKKYAKACLIYAKAISIFKSIRGIEAGILINALINYGEALYNSKEYRKADFIFREALSLIENQDDVRRTFINTRIDEIKKKR